MRRLLGWLVRAFDAASAITDTRQPVSRSSLSPITAIAAAKGDGTRLVDVHQLAADIGLQVRHVADLPDGITAHLHHWRSPHTCFDDPWVLDIAANLSISRERITIARMIMLRTIFADKLILNGDSQHSATDNGRAAQAEGHRWSANSLTAQDNTQALQAAIRLLFPEPLLRKLHVYGLTDGEIAEDLQTTPEAVRIRLRSLGVIDQAA